MKLRCDSRGARYGLTLLLLVMIIPAVFVANAGERRHCLRATIDEVFMLPNGSLHPPGELRLCLIRSMSPVSAAHQTHIDGQAVGYFRSIRTNLGNPNPNGPAPPYFEFIRNARGELELQGYAWTDGTTVLAYDLTQLNKKKFEYKVTTREQLTARDATKRPGSEEPTIIRLAAVR